MAPPHAWLRTHFCQLSAAASLATAAAEFDGAVAAGCCHGHAMPPLRRKGRRKTTKSGPQSPRRPARYTHPSNSHTGTTHTSIHPTHKCMHACMHAYLCISVPMHREHNTHVLHISTATCVLLDVMMMTVIIVYSWQSQAQDTNVH